MYGLTLTSKDLKKASKRLLTACAALALTFAVNANAGLVGSTYDFNASVTGSTLIGATNGSYTDPLNAGFCVGPPVACGVGSGLFGTYSFADVTPTLSTITFNFAGSTNFASGTFVIDLGDFITIDGSTITGVTHASGNLNEGNFTSVVWNGTNAVFTGSPGFVYDAVGGATVVFDVAMTSAAVPEPGSLALVGIAALGFAVSRRRRHPL